jgi:hypothetical protein
MRSWIWPTMSGVASSWRPDTSSVGVVISWSRSVMSHVLSEPTT